MKKMIIEGRSGVLILNFFLTNPFWTLWNDRFFVAIATQVSQVNQAVNLSEIVFRSWGNDIVRFNQNIPLIDNLLIPILYPKIN